MSPTFSASHAEAGQALEVLHADQSKEASSPRPFSTRRTGGEGTLDAQPQPVHQASATQKDGPDGFQRVLKIDQKAVSWSCWKQKGEVTMSCDED